VVAGVGEEFFGVGGIEAKMMAQSWGSGSSGLATVDDGKRCTPARVSLIVGIAPVGSDAERCAGCSHVPDKL
jgi:hypothetical protein